MKDLLVQSLAKTQTQSVRGVEQILSKKLQPASQAPDLSQVWALADFGLAQAKILGDASPESLGRLRAQLARDRFVEAWHIEKAGMSFAAKMSLLAESFNEQKLYSLFAAEEARHFHYLQSILGTEAQPGGPFIDLLNEIIVSAERRPLLFIIQVVLEGWGIDHYALMMKTCQQAEIKQALGIVLADEAAHHGSGVALFNEADLSPAEFDYILETMHAFLSMVSVGPVSVVDAVEHNLQGSLNSEQRQHLLSQMQAQSETQRKLHLLRQLMIKADAQRLLAALDQKNGFALRF